MPTPRYIRLEPEQDARLREVEQDPNLRSKVRLRAQVLRLSGRGESIKGISSYTGRSEASISRDLETAGRIVASRGSPTARRPATRRV